MLYPKSKEKALAPELFRSPTSEYRGTPFWAWNGELNREELLEQIAIFKKMGLGGFHMHMRTGLDAPYLEPPFMEHIRACVDEARKEGMLAWLYDEDRWPSGSAGGKVTRNRPENARKTLLFTAEPYAPERPHQAKGPEPGRGQNSVRQDNGELLAVYDIVLDGDGCLAEYRRIGEADSTRGAKWYAYMEHATADPWFNDQAYVDTLNPQAIREFIETTHETYKKWVGGDFGGAAPGIFTDEPQFAPKQALDFAAQQKDLFLSWTDCLPELYRARYQEDLLDVLPELIWELPGGRLSRARWRYQNLVTDRFLESYCKQIGQWCRENNLLLTGHLMGEPTLESQTQAVGDAMRCYPEFGLPGIDMLCDFREYTTAKQAQSMARQQGAEGVLSELYGVTGWDCDFRTYKLQGDWQAALGVTLRVPHLSWYTMQGEAKRDYPASIGYQSPWWEEFPLIEDHFARLNTALTQGRPAVTVGVVHPIESYWLLFGPAAQTAGARGQMEEQFAGLCEWLLFGNIDFDYINEARFPEQCPAPGAPIQVGECAYRVVLVPPVRTLRSSTVERLEALLNGGGRVIFLGPCPAYVDGEPSDRCRELFSRAEHLGFDRESILAALEPERMIDIRHENGRRADRLLYQLREDGDCKWLFLCNGKTPESPDVDPAPTLRFALRGEYALEAFDTLTGETAPLPAQYENGWTVFSRVWHIHDSLLVRLIPGQGTPSSVEQAEALGAPSLTLEPVEIRLSEPNMLLLDMAEYALNDGDFRPMEELLRIDNMARAELGIPLRRKEVVQPYLLPKGEPKDRLRLLFRIRSEVHITGAKLALECPESARVTLNGLGVPTVRPDGWFVDKSIKTVPLPELGAGESRLEIAVPIGPRTNLEAFYLLGDFGVRVSGCKKVLTAPVRTLAFGDITRQGLPFYTGNVEYGFRVRSEGDFTIRVPHYRGGLVKVLVDGEDRGNIAFSPYALRVKAEPGEHFVVLRLYGTRQNGFGQLHHTQGVYFYQSPNSWRSAGDLWCYEYQLKAAGILRSPEVYGGVILDGSGRRGEGPGHISDQS